MRIIDTILFVVALAGAALVFRGGRRALPGDALMGLLLTTVAAGAYFLLFSLTRVSWLASLGFGAGLLALLATRAGRERPWGRGLVAVFVLGMAASAAVEHRLVSAGNALLTIEPYRQGRGWAFDEPRLGLRGEPFVQGAPEIIDRLVTGVPGSEKAVRLIFSQHPFPGAQLRLDRRGEQDGGNWYHADAYGLDGWLCPALFRFFPRAPGHLYVSAEPR